uniref:ATP-dependent RNA helicase n=1 Tax=Arcella intermedia TaxID=1963864 RepID=A0A6B2L0Q4_9EUKA
MQTDPPEQQNPKDHKKQTKSKRDNKDKVLPKWMENATLLGEELEPLEPWLDKYNFHPQIAENIRHLKFKTLFPVQSVIIPEILCTQAIGGDICVSAPTGSGKTLGYVIPIVQSLVNRVVTRLRALVLVPTKILVAQVHSVFLQMTRGTDLKVAALGNETLNKDKKVLMGNYKGDLVGGHSEVDILISTPGRFVDHLTGTPGFTLQHLMFLVVDEADRLLMASYQEWLSRALEAINSQREGQFITSEKNRSMFFDACNMRSNQEISNYPPLRKMLYSATLTQNPKKIANLKLVNPKFFTASAVGFKLSPNLKQYIVQCHQDEKPLFLYMLMSHFKAQQVLCFTSSVESAHRLCLLINILAEDLKSDLRAVEYSSNIPTKQLNRLMEDIKAGKVKFIVCSDVMTRGLDVIDVDLVINYEVPSYSRTYVHRVGRTARAGRPGTSITVAKFEEVGFFNRLISNLENNEQERYLFDFEYEIKPFVPAYKGALKKLDALISGEKHRQPNYTQNLRKGNTPLTTQVPRDQDIIMDALKHSADILLFGGGNYEPFVPPTTQPQ